MQSRSVWRLSPLSRWWRRRRRGRAAAGWAVVSGHQRPLQVRIGRHRGSGGAAVLDLARAADCVRRQAAEPARAGIRAARVHARGRSPRPADRNVARDRACGARRAQLRDLSCWIDPACARRAAANRVGHAGQPDGSAGIRAIPECLREGSTFQCLDADRRDQEGEPGLRILREVHLPLLRHPACARRHSRAREGDRMVRCAAAAGTGTRGHVQSLQGPAQARHRKRPYGRHCGSAVPVESAHPHRHVAALGRQQQLGRGTEQERRHRRRRDAGFAEARLDEAARRLDHGPEAAGLPAEPHRCRARAAGGRDLQARMRQLS